MFAIRRGGIYPARVFRVVDVWMPLANSANGQLAGGMYAAPTGDAQTPLEVRNGYGPAMQAIRGYPAKNGR